MSTFYNVGSADITDGLIDYEISSGQDYFILLSAPSNANIQIRLNENTAPLIPIKEHWQFKSADVKKIFITADAIAGEKIKWGQADGNLEITTNPTINAIDTISQMGVTFAEQLDKIINPYEESGVIQETTSASSLTTLLNITADFDKCAFLLTPPSITSVSGCKVGFGYLNVYIDDILFFTVSALGLNSSTYPVSTFKTETFLSENLRNKNIKIESDAHSGSTVNYSIIKYNKKV